MKTFAAKSVLGKGPEGGTCLMGSDPEKYGGEGGILTLTYRLSQRVFGNMREDRIRTGAFYDLVFCNSFNCFA